MRSFMLFSLLVFYCFSMALSGCGGGGSSTSNPQSDTKPVAAAGVDQAVLVGSLVVLDGSGSYDPGGNALNYSWTLISVPTGSSVVITNATSTIAYLIPDIAGSYTIQLVVNNGIVVSVADTLVVTASGSGNMPPIANAGVDQSVDAGVQVVLDGSGSSSPDGIQLSYTWILSSTPEGSAASITNATSVNASFTPDVAGSYTVQLVVFDGVYTSMYDSMVVTAGAKNVFSIVSYTPQNQETDVSFVKAIVININGEVNQSSFSNKFTMSGYLGAEVFGNFKFEPSKITFTPTEELSFKQIYTVTIPSDILDSSGIPIGQGATWSFTTMENPVTYSYFQVPTYSKMIAYDGDTLWTGSYGIYADNYSFSSYSLNGIKGTGCILDPSIGNSLTAGFTYDGSNFWIHDGTSPVFAQFNKSGEVISSFSVSLQNPVSLAWDGQYFWTIDLASDKAVQFDKSGNIISYFPVNSRAWSIAVDGSSIWTIDSKNTNYKHVYINKYNQQGTLLATFPISAYAEIQSAVFANGLLYFVELARPTTITTKYNVGKIRIDFLD
ncbi:MAG: Ig-like domain-containing protein [Proteobacteria bacterium]|nr:Ig-like domain-containing protein [Pseudomonadota bacterium]MBU1687970.1 Ig-like domain-containing protein [Pseudomonadota bacterium]